MASHIWRKEIPESQMKLLVCHTMPTRNRVQSVVNTKQCVVCVLSSSHLMRSASTELYRFDGLISYATAPIDDGMSSSRNAVRTIGHRQRFMYQPTPTDSHRSHESEGDKKIVIYIPFLHLEFVSLVLPVCNRFNFFFHCSSVVLRCAGPLCRDTFFLRPK